jgi:hypothetical protein
MKLTTNPLKAEYPRRPCTNETRSGYSRGLLSKVFLYSGFLKPRLNPWTGKETFLDLYMLIDTPMRLVSSFKILNFGGAMQNINTIKVVQRRNAGQCWRVRDFNFDE